MKFPTALILSLFIFDAGWATEALRPDLKPKAKPATYAGFLEASGPRRVFVLKNGTWQSALPDAESIEALNQARNSVSEPGKWTVFHDGKVHGQISAEPVPTVTMFKDVGLQQVTGKKPRLPVQKVESQFSSFDEPRVRPFLLTTESTVQDPDRWKPDRNKAVPPKAKADFIRIFGDQAAYDVADAEDSTAKKYSIKESEIVLTKAYMTTAGDLRARLIGLKLQLAENLNVSCENEGDRCQAVPTYWFYIANGKAPKFVATAGALVETADLNSDGVSDFAFRVSEYNRSGYSILDGKTHTLTQAHWTYH